MEEKADILIVDDNTSLCRTMSFVLRRQGRTGGHPVGHPEGDERNGDGDGERHQGGATGGRDGRGHSAAGRGDRRIGAGGVTEGGRRTAASLGCGMEILPARKLQ